MGMEDDLGLGGASPPPPAATALSLNSRVAATAAASFPSLEPVEQQRKKRLMKIREVGSRSRARKHAHLTKIQSELHHLLHENQQLRFKYDQLRASVEVSVPVRVPVPGSKTLQRVLSAHF